MSNNLYAALHDLQELSLEDNQPNITRELLIDVAEITQNRVATFVQKHGRHPIYTLNLLREVSHKRVKMLDGLEKDDNPKDHYFSFIPVNVDTFEQKHNMERIFTRDFLQQIAHRKAKALALKGKGKFLSPYNGEQYVVGDIEPEAEVVHVTFFSRVEMHAGWQKLEKCSDSLERLRKLNNEKGDEWLAVPFMLSGGALDDNQDHEDPKKMGNWAQELKEMDQLWKQSPLRAEVQEAFETAPKTCVHIKRIVCFGLGKMFEEDRHCKDNYLQHLAAFDMAAILETIARAQDPEAPEVQVFLQDPCYQEKDKRLLRNLRPTVQFTEDPRGLLAIDEHTLVIGLHLPHWFPLMQIIADMFEEGKGPAGLIVDNLQRQSRAPGMYYWDDRISPRSERMLKGYERADKKFGRKALGKELEEKLCFWHDEQRHWLEESGILFRKREQTKEQEICFSVALTDKGCTSM